MTATLTFALASFALLSSQTPADTPERLICNAAALPANAYGADVPAGSIRQAKTTLGTKIQLGASNVPCEQASEAFGEVYAEFSRLEKLTSMSDPGSGLEQINKNAGIAPVVVDNELYALIELALGFAEMSSGAFDPTFAAMDGVWKFERGEQGDGELPSAETVAAAKAHVSYKNVVVDEEKRSVFLKDKDARLSLGGITRGYATDAAVRILRRRGLKDFIVRSGGDMYIEGDPGGKDRRIGIPDPRGNKAFALVEVRGRAFNISRDADKSYVKEGVRYHHIIDPRTGYPAHHARTVAVIAADATTADALSTAIFVLGPTAGIALAEGRRGVECLIVDAQNQVHVSSGFGPRLEIGAPTAKSP